MKYKKISFSVLEEIENKKIEKEIINIKNVHLQTQKNSKQIKLLIGYQEEYLKKRDSKIMLGVSVYQWKNYNDFIAVLKVIIQDNINNLKKNQKIIEETVKRWSKYQIKLQIWKRLNLIHKKKILKIKTLQEEILHDNCAQLKFLKQG